MIVYSILIVLLAFILPFTIAFLQKKLDILNFLWTQLLRFIVLLGSLYLVSRFLLHRDLFVATSYNLIFSMQLLGLIILGVLISFLLNRYLHLDQHLKIINLTKVTPKRVILAILLSLLAALSVFIYEGSYWATKNFGLLNPEQVIYNLKQPMEGADSSFIISFLNGPLLDTILVLICLLPLFFVLSHCEFQIIHRPKLVHWGVAAMTILASGALIYSGAVNIDAKGFIKYFTSSSTFIEENYVDPATTKLTFPKKKRNLIYIYVESLESTSIDKLQGGEMSTNLLPELTELSSEGIHFSNSDKPFGGAYQFYGTGWTIAGMVAQTAGIPLKVPIDGNSYATSKSDSFLPGATTLNDILAEEGYQQTFLLGSDATFGGRRSYFTQHGKVTIDDYLAAKKENRIPKNYKVWWGYEDSKLFDYAQEDLSQLSTSSKPFNFTMLTANTHHIGGYPEKDMPKTYSEQYSNVIAYTDTQLVTFVNWLKQQPFYNNTTVIIHGDHLSMDADYYAKKKISSSKRHTFNLILNAPIDKSTVKTRNRTYGTFNMFPTTLAALGVDIKGNRLGLGTNLFSNEKTLAEKYGRKKLNSELSQSSKFYNDRFIYDKEK
ncbi:LTA synthase family protein [Lapidilactobacillus luobeiensis]|uniref:LTA synthase family protein n=1 Tax=Lapidilactobacillus luobeiensis TaxID=2950371 RepID=UPI0021C400DA|nr:LTA synthase family protein [Lapidilactobacillus luobeiensis]